MKRILVACFLLASCKNPEIRVYHKKCVITNVTSRELYSGTIPGITYILETDCGYRLTSRHSANIGDTVTVEIHKVSKN